MNSFSGTYDAKDGGTLRFGDITSTEMAGSDAANKQESTFYEALGKTRRFSIEGGKLILNSNNNDTLAILVRQ